jgi:hypothetical protein
MRTVDVIFHGVTFSPLTDSGVADLCGVAVLVGCVSRVITGAGVIVGVFVGSTKTQEANKAQRMDNRIMRIILYPFPSPAPA